MGQLPLSVDVLVAGTLRLSSQGAQSSQGSRAQEQRMICPCPLAGETASATLIKQRMEPEFQKEEEGYRGLESGPESLTARGGQAHPSPDL